MRVKLREFSMADVDAVTRLLSAGPEISSHTATIPFPYTEDHARSFISELSTSNGKAFAIVSEPDGELLGSIGIIGSGPEVEIGYWVGKPFWGRGYATEAVSQLIDMARSLRMTCLMAWVFVGNAASARVLEKNGFEFQGEDEKDLPLRGGLRRLYHYRLRL